MGEQLGFRVGGLGVELADERWWFSLVLISVVESMWRLGLPGGDSLYPERPGEPDCTYYIRTGSCGYGERCRYNHPPDRGAVGILGPTLFN